MDALESTTFVGIDLHLDSVTVAVLPGREDRCREVRTLPNDLPKLKRFFTRLARTERVRTCYEASGCGYVLHRALTEWGVACEVIAPSLIPIRPGDRCKTDRRDAQKLAHFYRAGELTPIRIPSPEEEAVRSVTRCRLALTREIQRSRRYITTFLQARGLKFRQTKNWSVAYWRWLRGLSFAGPDAATFSLYLELLEYKLIQRDTLDTRLEEIAGREPYREPVGRLRRLRGIDTLTALILVSELGDIRRFASPRHLMAYLGLSVKESSSGGVERRGGITKTGNPRCRRVLVEAAWKYHWFPRPSKGLRERRASQPPEVATHAVRAEHRLHQRFMRLLHRMPSSKAATAIARELAGFVWAVLMPRTRYLHPHTTR